MPVPAHAATTWHVRAGASTPDAAIATSAFYPRDITVQPGDTIKFQLGGFHTITFNRPPGVPVLALLGPPSTSATLTGSPAPINSGGLAPPASFTLNVAGGIAPGTYNFRCVLHPLMEGSVTVIPPTEALPKTDAQYTAAADKQIVKDLKAGARIARESERAAARAKDLDDHEGIEVAAGGGNGVASSFRFFGPGSPVHVGDVVTFVNRDEFEPHTVTFNTDFAPGDPAELFPLGSPATFTGVEPLHSGFLLSKDLLEFFQIPPSIPVQPRMQFAVKFNKAGSFRYVCTLHDEIGMVATITVRP
jgi:plastocyanin